MYSRAMAELEAWLIGWPAAAVAFFISGGCAWGTLLRWQRRRLGAESTLVYDDGEPLIRTLGLEIH